MRSRCDGRALTEKLVRYSDNGTTTSSVNFPEVALPAHLGKGCLLHVHHNMPGVLSAINRVFADNGINIAAQHLQTRGDVGYVAIEVDAVHAHIALSGLAGVTGTLRTRVLF